MLKNTIASLAMLGLFLSAPLMAASTNAKAAKPKEMTFQGHIVSIDSPGRTFVVRSDVKGDAKEMRFPVGRESNLMIDGQRHLLSQLEKGEHVTVTYEASAQPLAKEVVRHHGTGPTK